MKKQIYYIIILTLYILQPYSAYALNESDFNAGRIIDDSVFFNKDSMTVSQIQDFLNSKVASCDTNHASSVGDSGTIYSAPFVCLKDYYENPNSIYNIYYNGQPRTFYRNNSYEFTSLQDYINPSNKISYIQATVKSLNGVRPEGSISAAEIIYNAAQKYNINPQVLIVTLQKEQRLITDTWPVAWQYQSAMGYACPDNGPCSGKYAGFSAQIDNAAWQFRDYANNPQKYNFSAKSLGVIYYNPGPSYFDKDLIKWIYYGRFGYKRDQEYCGNSSVYIHNQATANLYNYTPYQPNKAALTGLSDSSSGGGDVCSAYGNRNFFWYFNVWFGSTTRTIIKSPSSNSVYLIDGNKKRLFPNEETYFSYGYRWSDVSYAITASEFANIPNGDAVEYNINFRNGRLIKSSNSPVVYLVDNGIKYAFPDEATFLNYGYKWGDIVNVSSLEVSLLQNYSTSIRNGRLIKSSNSPVVYLVDNGIKYAFPDEATFLNYGYKWGDIVNVSSLEVSLLQNGGYKT